ncbi:hypothetical protein O181_015509 [Austropuccinia psidii MF-1]|uniref:DUF4219 domain-containing protein n=1 Tax=Austropuccinia psidii MF-1 TaxID=1389203 RepID=A0A9Q3GQX1_9BASI|nr:hypothetical protein [Austropuccinia psidii MF-1]
MTTKTPDSKDTSSIPMLDGSSFSRWSVCMKAHLRSRDLLEVCEHPPGEGASTITINRWTKSSYEALSAVLSRINKRDLLELINSETSEKATLLWSQINNQYALKTPVNRGRVWMDWQRCFYNENLQQYIEDCRKLMLDLESVNIHAPNEILTFSLLGKLGRDPKLDQLVEGLTLNEEGIQRPKIILSRLQDYVKLMRIKEPIKDLSASAHVSTINGPYKVVYYCTDGKHNPKCTTNKEEECFSEQPHL